MKVSRATNYVLVARNKEEMLKIKENVKVNVLVIELDLLKEKNVFKLYDICKDEKHISLYLVAFVGNDVIFSGNALQFHGGTGKRKGRLQG